MADYDEEKSDFDNLRQNIINLNQINDEEQKSLQDRLYKMIDYSIKRQDWYEDQKQKILQIGLAILGTSAAFSALVAKLTFDEDTGLGLATLILAWIFVVCVFSTGFKLIYSYTRTISQNHPYRQVVDIRSWYFKYNLNSEHPASLSKDSNKAKAQVQEIVTNFDKYLSRWMEFATTKGRFIKEDLEQVFILQLLQKYRSDQLKEMSKTLYRGIKISSIFLGLTLLSLFINKFITANATSNDNQTEKNNGLLLPEKITNKDDSILSLQSDTLRSSSSLQNTLNNLSTDTIRGLNQAPDSIKNRRISSMKKPE